MKFTFLWWNITIERIPKEAREKLPPSTTTLSVKRLKKRGFTKCDTTDKVDMTEAYAKLRAKQFRKVGKYMRAYKCQFCSNWHLTHQRRLW